MIQGEVGMDAGWSVTLCYTSPSSPCAGTSSGVLSKRPSTGSPGCSYQPIGQLSLLLDWGLQDWAQILGPQRSHCRCLPSPRIVCSSGSWGICRQGPSCEPKGHYRHASRDRHGSCTLKPHLLRTWPSLQLFPYPGHSLGPLWTHSQKYAWVNTSCAEHLQILQFIRLSYHNPSCSISSYWSSDFLWLVCSRTHSLQKKVQASHSLLNSWELHSSSADTHIPHINGHLHTPNYRGYILGQFPTVSQCITGCFGSAGTRKSTSVTQSLCDLTWFYVLRKHREENACSWTLSNLVWIAKAQQRLNHTCDGWWEGGRWNIPEEKKRVFGLTCFQGCWRKTERGGSSSWLDAFE